MTPPRTGADVDGGSARQERPTAQHAATTALLVLLVEVTGLA
ncbi:hypothetical protein ABT324_27885 [Saccharopolyspora sp. NPDC000359]